MLLVTRDPIVHQLGGSTTYAIGLIRLLVELGATVRVLSTVGAGRSPRPWFFVKAELPPGVPLCVPGYVRVGGAYLRVWSSRAWARYVLRAAERWAWLRPVAAGARAIFAGSVCEYAWDLTEPTPAERALVAEETRWFRPTTLLANYAYWGALLGDAGLKLAQPAMKRVILMHDLLSARVKSFEAQGRALDCPRIDEATELGWLAGADTLLAAQAREAEAIAPKLQARVLVLPVTLLAHAPAESPQASLCLFVGSNIAPNENALQWMIEEIWPRVRARVPDARLAVVGTVAGAAARMLEGRQPEGVIAVGPVASLEREYARAAVCVVPLRIGSGIKIKLLEALSYGKAIVSTSVGVEGVEQETGGVVTVADEAEAFAAGVVALLQDAAARRALEARAYELARVRFDPRRTLDAAFLEAVL